MKTKITPLLGLLLSLQAQAQSSGAPQRDPWLPPAARATAPSPETRGAALQAQVLAKLERQFQMADSSRRGALNLEEARRAGWGFAVQHFEAIDSRGRGEIRIQDLRAYLQGRSTLQPPTF